MTKKMKKNLKFKLISIATTIMGLTVLTGVNQTTMAMNDNGIIQSLGDRTKEEDFINTCKTVCDNISGYEKLNLNNKEDFKKFKNDYPDLYNNLKSNFNSNYKSMDTLVDKNLSDSEKNNLVNEFVNQGIINKGNIAMVINNPGGGFGLFEDVPSIEGEFRNGKANDFSYILSDKIAEKVKEISKEDGYTFSISSLVRPDRSIKEYYDKDGNYIGNIEHTILPDLSYKRANEEKGEFVYDIYPSARDHIDANTSYLKKLVEVVNDANDMLKNTPEYKNGELIYLKKAVEAKKDKAFIKNGKVYFPDNVYFFSHEINNDNYYNLDRHYMTEIESDKVTKEVQNDLGTKTRKTNLNELNNTGYAKVTDVKKSLSKQNAPKLQTEENGPTTYYNGVTGIITSNECAANNKKVATTIMRYLLGDLNLQDYELIYDDNDRAPRSGYTFRNKGTSRTFTQLANVQGSNVSSNGTFFGFTDNPDEAKKLFDSKNIKYVANKFALATCEIMGRFIKQDPYYTPTSATVIMTPKTKIVDGKIVYGMEITVEVNGSRLKTKENLEKIEGNKVQVAVVVKNANTDNKKQLDDGSYPPEHERKLNIEKEGNKIKLTNKRIYYPKNQEINLTPGEEANNQYYVNTYIVYYDNEGNITKKEIPTLNMYCTEFRKAKLDNGKEIVYLKHNNIVEDPVIKEKMKKFEAKNPYLVTLMNNREIEKQIKSKEEIEKEKKIQLDCKMLDMKESLIKEKIKSYLCEDKNRKEKLENYIKDTEEMINQYEQDNRNKLDSDVKKVEESANESKLDESTKLTEKSVDEVKKVEESANESKLDESTKLTEKSVDEIKQTDSKQQ